MNYSPPSRCTRLEEGASIRRSLVSRLRGVKFTEKAQLRYVAIMTQVTTAQGDMARTLQAPANQLRILQAQITQTARALGNILFHS